MKNMIKNQISKKIIISITLLLLFCIAISSANAVNVTLNPSDPGGVNSAVSNVTTGGDVDNTITLNPGTYNKTTDRNNNITFSGKNLTIQGNGSPDSVIIDAQSLGRIFSITGASNLTLINITLINGNSTIGGSIFNTGGTLTLTNCILTNNTASSYGGVIYNTRSNMTITNSHFTNNTVTSNSYGGGAIFNSGANMTVTSSYFTANTAGNSGGAIYNNNGVNMTILDSHFTNNMAINTSGGAIFNSGANTIINNSNFTNNTAPRNGGAIQSRGINITVNNSNFNDNTAGNDGGAIEHSGNNLTITNSTFANNTAASSGGAVYNYRSIMQVNNSDFINNTANALSSYGGGGIYTTGGDNITINNSRFVNNTASNYGGAIDIYYGNNITINNSNFTDNTASTNGGAIFNTAGSNITTNNSNFNNNIAIINGGAIYNKDEMNVLNSSFNDNSANNLGGVIFNDGSMLVSGNIMDGNSAALGQEIYNNGSMGVLNLTYLNNSTVTVNNNSSVVLYATLTDDMGNPVTGQNISFFVNGTFIGSHEAIEGFANITYFVTQGTAVVPVTGDYAGHVGFSIIIKNGQLLIVPNTTVTSEITLNDDEYKINETVHGKITITNTGNNTATNVTTKVNFPPSFVLNSSSVVVSQGTFDPTTNIWSIGDLAPGEVATMTFTGKFTTEGEHTISIETIGDNFETSTDSATAFVEEPIPPTPPEPPEPTPTPENETTENQAAATAAMKKTGLPINLILLVLLSLIGFGYYRKQ